MTTKTLTGCYYPGYTLGSQYSGLIIGASATVGATGVVAQQKATVTNFGQIHASDRYSGVFLHDGGAVINGSAADTTASITGAYGIRAYSAAIRNFGTIQANSFGVGVSITNYGGASLTNGSAGDTSAVIFGQYGGVSTSLSPASISNFGTIDGGGYGVSLAAGWRLINGSSSDQAALIGGRDGVYASQKADVVTNLATISAIYCGVVLGVTGTLTNGSSTNSAALVAGDEGAGVVVEADSSTVTNFGTIEGRAGVAVRFDGGGGRLVAAAGSVFLGVADVGDSNIDVLSGRSTFAGGIDTYGTLTGTGALALTGGSTTFAAGTRLNVADIEESGALTQVEVETSLSDSRLWMQTGGSISVAASDRLSFSGIGDSFAGTLAGAGAVAFTGGSATLDGATLTAASVVIDGASVTAAGTVTIASVLTLDGGALGAAAGATLLVEGALVGSAGTGLGVVAAKLTDSGVIEAATGALDLGAGIVGSGLLKIDAGASLELDGAVAKTLTVTFAGAASTLDLAAPSAMGATIAGFASGDAIDLLKITATSASLNKLDQLIVLNGGVRVATLRLSGAYQGLTFAVGSDGAGGSAITVSAAPMVTSAFAQAMAAVGGVAPVTGFPTGGAPALAPTTGLVSPGAR